ncbi:MAG: hypothetical protein ABIC91_07465 [Nanoarchaeota archaeon]|nr:hypothetical protein [Nanoarchaeota archaeon]MBU1030727.1 hypothetical protein [Nanoarchaeota archaeon]MBU1849194.1 hypothetical protein [Nanoarchaeota archaeon]
MAVTVKNNPILRSLVALKLQRFAKRNISTLILELMTAFHNLNLDEFSKKLKKDSAKANDYYVFLKRILLLRQELMKILHLPRLSAKFRNELENIIFLYYGKDYIHYSINFRNLINTYKSSPKTVESYLVYMKSAGIENYSMLQLLLDDIMITKLKKFHFINKKYLKEAEANLERLHAEMTQRETSVSSINLAENSSTKVLLKKGKHILSNLHQIQTVLHKSGGIINNAVIEIFGRLASFFKKDLNSFTIGIYASLGKLRKGMLVMRVALMLLVIIGSLIGFATETMAAEGGNVLSAVGADMNSDPLMSEIASHDNFVNYLQDETIVNMFNVKNADDLAEALGTYASHMSLKELLDSRLSTNNIDESFEALFNAAVDRTGLTSYDEIMEGANVNTIVNVTGNIDGNTVDFCITDFPERLLVVGEDYDRTRESGIIQSIGKIDSFFNVKQSVTVKPVMLNHNPGASIVFEKIEHETANGINFINNIRTAENLQRINSMKNLTVRIEKIFSFEKPN